MKMKYKPITHINPCFWQKKLLMRIFVMSCSIMVEFRFYVTNPYGVDPGQIRLNTERVDYATAH